MYILNCSFWQILSKVQDRVVATTAQQTDRRTKTARLGVSSFKTMSLDR